jgi:hypothetical protein
VKGNKELTFIMILPLQMFENYTVSDKNQMSPVCLFIQIQIFKKRKTKSMLLICSINFGVFFGCILSQIYWVESQLRFEFE